MAVVTFDAHSLRALANFLDAVDEICCNIAVRPSLGSAIDLDGTETPFVLGFDGDFNSVLVLNVE